MPKRAWWLGTAVAICAAVIVGCNGGGTPASPSGAGVGTDAKPGGTSAYQLNLSHIECVDTGQVEIHFVLLHVPDGITPGSLNWTNNKVAQTPVAPSRRTGNVWHYNILAAPGSFNVTSASVVVSGVTINLHNPGAYAGQYLCGQDGCTPTIPASWGAAEGQSVCRFTGIETASAECGLFGLAPDGRDAGNGTNSQASSKNAVLAVVRDGPCDNPAGTRYTFFTPVTQGEILTFPVAGSPISHITYCQCPGPVDNPLR